MRRLRLLPFYRGTCHVVQKGRPRAAPPQQRGGRAAPPLRQALAPSLSQMNLLFTPVVQPRTPLATPQSPPPNSMAMSPSMVSGSVAPPPSSTSVSPILTRPPIAASTPTKSWHAMRSGIRTATTVRASKTGSTSRPWFSPSMACAAPKPQPLPSNWLPGLLPNGSSFAQPLAALYTRACPSPLCAPCTSASERHKTLLTEPSTFSGTPVMASPPTTNPAPPTCQQPPLPPPHPPHIVHQHSLTSLTFPHLPTYTTSAAPSHLPSPSPPFPHRTTLP